MSSQKFTQGPWKRLNERSLAIYAERNGKQTLILTTEVLECKRPTDVSADEAAGEEVANSRLACAAPEMYEALQLSAKEWAHEVPKDCYSTGPCTGDLIQDHVVCPACVMLRAINTALAKAEGKQ